MTQYLIRSIEHNGETFTDVITVRDNERYQVVEAESKEQAEKIASDNKQCPSCGSWNAIDIYYYENNIPIFNEFHCYNCKYIIRDIKNFNNLCKKDIDNNELKAVISNQQNKLNNIYEASAKAQYERNLWQKRYKAIEEFINFKLEMTPASVQYGNVAIELNKQLKKNLHEYY